MEDYLNLETKSPFIIENKHSHYMKYRTAFTLAEVLITLGIIGVVAAMTMPTVINKTQDKEFEVQAKKAQSVLANGYKLMMAREGVFNMKDLSIWNECYSGSEYDHWKGPCAVRYYNDFFNIIDDKEIGLEVDQSLTYKIPKKSIPFRPWNEEEFAFTTADGMEYGITGVASNYTSFSAYVDVNGARKPNTVGRDLRKLSTDDSGKFIDVTQSIIDAEGCSRDNLFLCVTERDCNDAGGRYLDYFTHYGCVI